MRNLILPFFVLLAFLSCTEEKELHVHFDDLDTYYIEKDQLPKMGQQHAVYVPAYSNLYYENDLRKAYFTVVLSLRNVSFTDSVYFDQIQFYSSEGKLLKEFNDKILVLRPMESFEYIVESPNKQGGPGANFIINYVTKTNLKNPPFIEAVMLGTIGNYGFAFTSPGINIDK